MITIPTTAQISDAILNHLETSLGQTTSVLPKAFLRVLSKVLAGAILILYKYGGFIYLQQFVSTASNENTTINGVIVNPLADWAARYGVAAQVPATAAELTITITVENQVGSLSAGTQLINSDNGVTYITKTSVALSASTVQVDIIAAADQSGGGGLGEIGNLSVSDTLTFANPLANVARVVVVAAIVVTGADAETTAAFRQRVIDTVRARPQGGAYADYRAWGAAVAGIAQVYPYTGDPAGEVDVYVESATETDGIPTSAQLTAVEDAIELDDVNGLATRRPTGALVNVLAITRPAWNAEVTGLSVPSDTPGAQAAITTAIEEYFLSREPFIVGLDPLPRVDVITRSAVLGTVEDVVTSLGGTFTTVTIERDDNPGVDVEIYILVEGEKAKSSGTAFV